MFEIVTFLKDHWLGLTGGTAGTVGLSFLAAAAKRVSGESRINANAGCILRDAKTTRALGKMLDADPNLSTILFADTERVYFQSRDGESRVAQSFDVRTPVLDEIKKYLDNPSAMTKAAKGAESGQACPGAEKNWARPRFLHALASVAFQRSARNVNDAMLEAAQTLASDKVKDTNTSGSCHIAIKWTDPATQKSHIVVMPANMRERVVIDEISGGCVVPLEGRTGLGLVRALAKSRMTA